MFLHCFCPTSISIVATAIWSFLMRMNAHDARMESFLDTLCSHTTFSTAGLAANRNCVYGVTTFGAMHRAGVWIGCCS